MSRLSNYTVRPVRRAGRTAPKDTRLSALADVLVAVTAGAITAFVLLPGIAAAQQTTNDKPEEAAEIRVTGGCVTVVGEDERFAIGPDCGEPRDALADEDTGEPAGGTASTGTAGPVAEEPDKGSGFSEGVAVPEPSARRALEDLIEDCKEERESQRSTGDDALYKPDAGPRDDYRREPACRRGAFPGGV